MENKYLYEICHDSINQPLSEWLVELPTILDTGVANTTSNTAGMGGWGVGGWVATKWWIKATSSLKTTKWHPLVPFSPPNITQSS